MSVYERDFDDVLNEIITTYANLASQPDTATGSTAWVMASVLASMIWGLYKYQDWISKQHFVDTADTAALNHWGSIYNITKDADDTDATYLNKILDRLRQPAAGGNALDYENWVTDQDECYYVYSDSTYYNNYVTVVDTPNNIFGTVGIYTIPTTDSANPTIIAGLRAATQTYIDSIRPIGMIGAYVYDATAVRHAITMEITEPSDATVNTTTLATAIDTDMSAMAPGDILYKSNLIAMAINFGAEDAMVSSPADSTTPPNDFYFRAGTITITTA